jgi:hypothetical protein
MKFIKHHFFKREGGGGELREYNGGKFDQSTL